MAKTIQILSGTTFTPTGDQIGALAQIVLWGAGANGGASLGCCCIGGSGGTSGCVASISNFLLTGATLNIQIPAANSASQCWFNSSATVSANSQSTSIAGMVGTTKVAGSLGGTPSAGGGGGAGAPGLSVAGGAGGNGVTSGGAGGGAGSPSYTLTAGGTQGPSPGGRGGNLAGSGVGSSPGAGGGGGGVGAAGASPGAGAPGVIVIIYTPASDAGTFPDYSADELIAQMNKPQALAYH